MQLFARKHEDSSFHSAENCAGVLIINGKKLDCLRNMQGNQNP